MNDGELMMFILFVFTSLSLRQCWVKKGIQQKDGGKEDNSYEDNRALFLCFTVWGTEGDKKRRRMEMGLFWGHLETNHIWPLLCLFYNLESTCWVEFIPFFFVFERKFKDSSIFLFPQV